MAANMQTDVAYFVVKATPDTPNADGQRFAFDTIDEAVDRLAGRPGIHAMVLPKLRGTKTRIAVGVHRSRGEWPGRLFIVEKVRTTEHVSLEDHEIDEQAIDDLYTAVGARR